MSRTSPPCARAISRSGWRHILNDHAIWIGSLGHEIHSVDQQPLALIGYCGVQLVY